MGPEPEQLSSYPIRDGRSPNVQQVFRVYWERNPQVSGLRLCTIILQRLLFEGTQTFPLS
jgi:hypothetical protein